MKKILIDMDHLKNLSVTINDITIKDKEYKEIVFHDADFMVYLNHMDCLHITMFDRESKDETQSIKESLLDQLSFLDFMFMKNLLRFKHKVKEIIIDRKTTGDGIDNFIIGFLGKLRGIV